MRYYPILSALLLSFGAPAACLAARLQIDAAPTADLPGFTTYKLFLALEGTETLRGIDADFRGPMNQMNPIGNAYVFHQGMDPLPFIPFILTEDSHFWFWPLQIMVSSASESSTNLTAAFSGLASLPLSNPALFAQIVTNDPESVSYHLEFDLGTGPDPVVFSGQLAIPEPSSLVLACVLLAVRPFLAWRRC